jgi:hypothetical protein
MICDTVSPTHAISRCIFHGMSARAKLTEMRQQLGEAIEVSVAQLAELDTLITDSQNPVHLAALRDEMRAVVPQQLGVLSHVRRMLRDPGGTRDVRR